MGALFTRLILNTVCRGGGVGSVRTHFLHQGPSALEKFTVGWGHRLKLIWKLEQELRNRGWSRPSAKLTVAEMRLEALGHKEGTVQVLMPG